MTILIADDNDTNRKLLGVLLKAHGYETVQAQTGAEALKWLLAAPGPVVGLIDWEMPEMEGIEVCRQARLRVNGPPLFLLLLTVRDAREDIVAGLSAGANDYVTKPFDQRELLARVAIGAQMVKLQEALANRVKELELVNEELHAFSRTVSHDLKTPLAGIEGFSQFLLDDYAAVLDERGQEYLHDVIFSAGRMREIIDDLMRLALVSKNPAQRETVNLTGLCEEIIPRLKTSGPARDVEFVVAQHAVAQADPGFCKIALENLLRNAWKFTSKRASARIEFGVMYSEGPTVYFIRDDGAGFDPAKAAKLFGAFQRLHADTDFAGTGIGLTIVQRIINGHSGKVWAQGAVGQGATFYFTLNA